MLVFNGLILWTLVTVSIEWARNGSPTLSGFAKTARSVLTNPLIVGILSGTLFSLTGLPLPTFVDRPVSMLGQWRRRCRWWCWGWGLPSTASAKAGS